MNPPGDGQDNSNPESQASEGQANELKPLSRWIWISLLLAVVGYPLSVGPVAWLDYHDGIPPSLLPAAEALYYPLIALDEVFPAFLSVLEIYIHFWLPDAG